MFCSDLPRRRMVILVTQSCVVGDLNLPSSRFFHGFPSYFVVWFLAMFGCSPIMIQSLLLCFSKFLLFISLLLLLFLMSILLVMDGCYQLSQLYKPHTITNHLFTMLPLVVLGALWTFQRREALLEWLRSDTHLQVTWLNRPFSGGPPR